MFAYSVLVVCLYSFSSFASDAAQCIAVASFRAENDAPIASQFPQICCVFMEVNDTKRIFDYLFFGLASC